MELWEKSRGGDPPSSHQMPQSPTLAGASRHQAAAAATGDGSKAAASTAAAAAAANIMSESAKINLSPDFKKKYEQWQKMKNPDNPAQQTAGNNGTIFFHCHPLTRNDFHVQQ